MLKGLFDKKKPEPSYPILPQVDSSLQGSVKGMFIIGDIGGLPLIKNAINQGVETVEKISELRGNGSGKASGSNDIYDVAIIGCGPAGLAATNAAHEQGLKYITIEQGKVADNIRNFTKGKLLFAEPLSLETKGSLQFEESSKEALLDQWTKLVAEKGLNINTHEAVTDIQKNGHFDITTVKGSYKAKYVILSIGTAGNPRKLKIPGEIEFPEKIAHRLLDPDDFKDKDILIVGGGDVAAEAALALCDTNKVTMSAIDKEFIFPKKRNIDSMRAREKEGKLSIILASKLNSIGKDEVEIEKDGQAQKLKNDFVFEMIGAELPLGFLKKIKVRLEGEWNAARYITLAAVSLLVYSVFAIKKPLWPYSVKLDAFGGKSLNELAVFFGRDTNFWYAALYTVIMIVYGHKAMQRWGKDDPWQKKRFMSLILFQVFFFFILPTFILDTWRAYGLVYAWPLFFNTFFDNPPLFYLVWGAILAFVGIPIMSVLYGKSYCTWICGCGGLAETLGDQWRHNSPKGERSRKWQFLNIIVMALVILTTIAVVLKLNGSVHMKAFYSMAVDYWLVGIIPVAMYPFWGGKIWCRYFCPLATLMEIISKKFSRYQIASNEKCITCTLCSKYCQVGVDVMAFAKNQKPFSNKESACIQCGICITVCPMDVLKFEQAQS